jgi:hypothetical protein
MEKPFILAKALAAKLIERRVPAVENELSKVCRELPPQEILGIVVQLMGENVRAAAAIAVRAQLPIAQQMELLHLVLTLGQTNKIRVLVSEVFAHRMSAEMFLVQLRKLFTNPCVMCWRMPEAETIGT